MSRPTRPLNERLSAPVVCAARWTVRWVCAAPGTYLWLAILAATSFALSHVSPAAYHGFLARRSTNLDELGRDPVRVMIVSALWTSRPSFVYYFVVYHLVHVPAERWLGTRRWLAVVALAHVLATLFSEGLVWVGILVHILPTGEAGALDLGVSYGFAGVIGVLAYRIAAPWRWWYLSIVLTLVVLPVATRHSFTDIGHLSAVLIGLACRPLTRGRGTWEPAATLARHRARHDATRAELAESDATDSGSARKSVDDPSDDDSDGPSGHSPDISRRRC
jgi:hypothetical protein